MQNKWTNNDTVQSEYPDFILMVSLTQGKGHPCIIWDQINPNRKYCLPVS